MFYSPDLTEPLVQHNDASWGGRILDFGPRLAEDPLQTGTPLGSGPYSLASARLFDQRMSLSGGAGEENQYISNSQINVDFEGLGSFGDLFDLPNSLDTDPFADIGIPLNQLPFMLATNLLGGLGGIGGAKADWNAGVVQDLFQSVTEINNTSSGIWKYSIAKKLKYLGNTTGTVVIDSTIDWTNRIVRCDLYSSSGTTSPDTAAHLYSNVDRDGNNLLASDVQLSAGVFKTDSDADTSFMGDSIWGENTNGDQVRLEIYVDYSDNGKLKADWTFVESGATNTDTIEVWLAFFAEATDQLTEFDTVDAP
jgi:hypothetical protein